VQIQDLVGDLSDGVSPPKGVLAHRPGRPHPPPRDPRQRIARPLRVQAEAARAALRKREQGARLY
jgi:hypothetical protein